ncbi:MAG: rhodanese-like domain-containing protein [Sulfobacillus thermosulfidooxidans]|uniref:Rhodanese-like domain-containing protein n=1 Tax=Sulfobacillus thermosulfidooxidans TaxID=28034 RepID=A0A2T2WFT6_SULTH|nr:MAG: rhodanese-like domain-containing protein [Sulfobacillus thermosulfidooxidans]
MNLMNLFRHPRQLKDLNPAQIDGFIQQTQPTVVDVRRAEEYQSGHLPDAMLAPLGTMAREMEKVDRNIPVLLICKTGHRSQAAAWDLLKMGFTDVQHLKGGMDQWKRENRPVERS